MPAIENHLPPLYWAVGLLVALLVHAVATVLLLQQPKHTPGASDQGEQGIEVGLGLAGSFITAIAQPETNSPAKEPEAPLTQTEQPPQELPQNENPNKDQTEQERINPSEPNSVEPAAQIQALAQLKQAPVAIPLPENKNAETKSQTVTEADSAQNAMAATEIAPQLNPSNSATTETTQHAASVATQQATGAEKDSRNGGNPGDAKNYMSRLMAWLNRHKSYPKEAKKNKQQGVVTLRFDIAKDGTILSKHLEKSSGIAQLDNAAIAMLGKASPVPAIPNTIKKEKITVVIPIEYSLITD